MSASDHPEWADAPRRRERRYHGQYLVVNDAPDHQPLRRRHKDRPPDPGLKRHYSDGGYRTDIEARHSWDDDAVGGHQGSRAVEYGEHRWKDGYEEDYDVPGPFRRSLRLPVSLQAAVEDHHILHQEEAERFPQLERTQSSGRMRSERMPAIEHHAYHRDEERYDNYVAVPDLSQSRYRNLDRLSLPVRNRGSTGPIPKAYQSHVPLPRPLSDPTEHFADAPLPHVSVSHHMPDLPQSAGNVIDPSDSRSEYGNQASRPPSRSASSATSTTKAASTMSTSFSGILGPKTYQYQSLGDMEFRLVRVLPERMSKLKCEILHRSLNDVPKYIAISYVWGDSLDTKPLILEGATILVSGNLYDALKAVRQKKEEVLVWIDALCIDQQNKDERAMQVRLMGHIYSRAIYVAIWLGPEADDSALAADLLLQVSNNAVTPQRIRSIHKHADSAALFSLFKRDYWRRLWVVQEVLLAERKMVYCGHSLFPWEVYRTAADAFWGLESDPHVRQGPSSFPDRSMLAQLGDESLLEVLRICRKKLSENPRDKVFGILGLLSEDTQREFPVDYSQSVKTVYIDVVDYIISTTDHLDVIRESIRFPLHVNSTGLPSWCPDWSHIPEVSGLGRTLGFAASRGTNGLTKARYRFHDERRKLEISAIKIDVIKATGIAVGTFCASQDYLTAFLHWRAILLHECNITKGDQNHPSHKAFCRTLCLGQIPEEWSRSRMWRDLCYHVFASLLRERLPRLSMGKDLKQYADITGLIEPDARRKFLQDHFGNRMMGRSFCITERGLMGLGSGYMIAGDIVVVPFGCSTPILLRPEGRRDEYCYVGDVYIDGYMHGEAVAEMEEGGSKVTVADYMLC